MIVGHIKLIDMGLSKNVDDLRTGTERTYSIVGTWDYIAPGVVRKLGLVLYSFFTLCFRGITPSRLWYVCFALHYLCNCGNKYTYLIII